LAIARKSHFYTEPLHQINAFLTALNCSIQRDMMGRMKGKRFVFIGAPMQTASKIKFIGCLFVLAFIAAVASAQAQFY
jgi:hypothetical protein